MTYFLYICENVFFMTDIVIPLAGKSGWGDNNELRYLLRSLEKNLPGGFNLHLYAKFLPKWIDRSKVYCHEIPRWYPEKARKYFGKKKHYENYYDVLNKLSLVCRDENIGENFLYCYDDVLLIKQLQEENELNIRPALMHYEDHKSNYDKRMTKWARTVMTAFDILKNISRPRYDYETHLPRYMNKTMLLKLFEIFPLENQIIPYAPSTLYYNFYYNGPEEKIIVQNTYKAGFYGDRNWGNAYIGSFPSRQKDQVKKAVKGKMWVNYNDAGLRHGVLQEWIEKKFPEKSKFEKR